MISKEMYELLIQIPRHSASGGISYTALVKLMSDNPDALLYEATFPAYDYINQSAERVKNSSFSLTEKGQAAIEDYERAMHNQEMVEKSLKVSRVAMWVSFATVFVAVLSLVKMFF